MAISIHPTAIVERGAELGEGSSVEAYAYLGKFVSIGPETVVRHHATIDGKTSMGSGNVVHPYAYVGAPTHDLKYKGGEPGLRIGNGNVFREYCTVHVATQADGTTIIGTGNVFLAYAHVAHDCVVGNGIIMSSQAALGGHVVVHDFTNIGWSSGIHQFCRVGKYAMVAAMGKVTQDVPPYMLAEGNPVRSRFPNFVNLQRHNFSEEDISRVKKIFKIFYSSGLNKAQAIEKMKTEEMENDICKEFLDFIDHSARGIA
jgi:UDP-N-acetylglucosamine acyltransferase